MSGYYYIKYYVSEREGIDYLFCWAGVLGLIVWELCVSSNRSQNINAVSNTSLVAMFIFECMHGHISYFPWPASVRFCVKLDHHLFHINVIFVPIIISEIAYCVSTAMSAHCLYMLLGVRAIASDLFIFFQFSFYWLIFYSFIMGTNHNIYDYIEWKRSVWEWSGRGHRDSTSSHRIPICCLQSR